MAAQVAKLSQLYTTGQIDTPTGQLEQQRILELYEQYAPREAQTVDVTGPQGQIVSIPLRQEIVKPYLPPAANSGILGWINKVRNNLYPGWAGEPIKQPNLLAWLNEARRNLYGDFAGAPLTSLNIMENVGQASPAFQEFREEYWGGPFGSNLAFKPK